jgi:serine/threonine-protein kinase HipA
VAGFDDHDLNEHICLDAARRAGLLAVNTTIASFDGESAIVVDRYDRDNSGSSIVRVHQEDLCQAMSFPPSSKYQNDRGPSPSDIARFLRLAMPPRTGDDAVRRFADALIWNWFIAGTDAHSKNYSLLLAGNQVRFAPIYDVASALPYDVHERKMRFAMEIGGDYRVFPMRNTWPAAAKDLGLESDYLVGRVRELGNLLPDTFSDAAAASDVVQLRRPMPQRLVELVSDRTNRCLATLK